MARIGIITCSDYTQGESGSGLIIDISKASARENPLMKSRQD